MTLFAIAFPVYMTIFFFIIVRFIFIIINKNKSTNNNKNNRGEHYCKGKKNKQREEIKKFMEDTSTNVKVLVASYGTLSTGVSINAIFNVIFADSFKSEQIIIQSIGRALRLHEDKKTALIFDLVDVFTHENMSNILFNHFLYFIYHITYCFLF